MKGKIIFVAFIFLFNLSLANAITQSELNEAKKLVDSQVNCKSLSDSQLELIGEYQMEVMHPKDAHELMHKMMGLREGSEAEEQFHISMATILYCGEFSGFGGFGDMMGGGMMNMMMGGDMMGNVMGYGMMGNLGYGGYWSIVNLLSTILLIGLVILVYLWIIKLWRDIKGKGRKK